MELINIELISNAWAQSDGGSPLGLFLPLILIFAVFYFLLIRPQQRRQKEHQAKLSRIQRGDKIVTSGGIFGTVVKAGDDVELLVEIASGVQVRVSRTMVSDVINPKAGPPPGKSGGLLSSLFGGGSSSQASAPAKAERPKASAKSAKKARGRPGKASAKSAKKARGRSKSSR